MTRLGYVRPVGLRLSSGSWSHPRVLRSLLSILGQSPLCAISTVSRQGRAHIHICYFAFSADLELFFISDPGSRHAMNLKTHRSAAVAVFPPAQRWGGPDRGVQLFGTCAAVGSGDVGRAEAVYRARFPNYSRHRWARTLPFYRFRPRRLTLLDEREFGDAVLVEVQLAVTSRRPRPPRRGGRRGTAGASSSSVDRAQSRRARRLSRR